jgi:hypothetical protein
VKKALLFTAAALMFTALMFTVGCDRDDGLRWRNFPDQRQQMQLAVGQRETSVLIQIGFPAEVSNDGTVKTYRYIRTTDRDYYRYDITFVEKDGIWFVSSYGPPK